MYRQVVSGKPWLSTWKAIGTTTRDFIQAGEAARKAKRYKEAFVWHQWADRLSPGRGDPWYYSGLVYEDQEQWSQALSAYAHASELGHFRATPLSSSHYRSGIINQGQLEPRQLDSALAAYTAAIEEDDFRNLWEEADCYYRRGQVLYWMREEPETYIADYKQAIKLNPKHVSAHVLLGYAYYIQHKDVAMAEAEIRLALELAQDPWAYFHLGEIYRREKRVEEARVMYTRALELAPNMEAAQKHLATLEEQD
jgi:tetratricopeptide (TPR) repeat protein